MKKPRIPAGVRGFFWRADIPVREWQARMPAVRFQKLFDCLTHGRYRCQERWGEGHALLARPGQRHG